MERASKGLPPVTQMEGKDLFCCANCQSYDVYMINRGRVEASEQENAEKLANAEYFAKIMDIEVDDILDKDIDFKRLKWSFFCEECATITNVRTEVDRY